MEGRSGHEEGRRRKPNQHQRLWSLAALGIRKLPGRDW